MDSQFDIEYKKLNKEQKKAVDSLDGPVMVIAGPGTGKTQVLALRIANILKETDMQDNAILCLTFTNAGVRAMRERLLRLIGSRGNKVVISTFHSFAKSLIDKYYTQIGFENEPQMLEDASAVILIDEILERGIWEYLRPRYESTHYVNDIRSLISLLKRENYTPEKFALEVEAQIENLKNNPENISSRGERKGELKKEILNTIDSLFKTKEVAKFYEEYEKLKFERGLMDYDDVLTYAVRLANESEEVKAFLQVNYQYILVDEHQDSSGVQNSFLQAVWGDVTQPDIFVVGDDRQLIYGFGGASIEQFESFRRIFGKTCEITLIENYRSTQNILDAAESLLQSNLASGALHSNKVSGNKLVVKECDYPRDEIIVIGSEIRKILENGTPAKEIAILVPKNYQIKDAIRVLADLDIPVSSGIKPSFFSEPHTQTIRRILNVIADPYDVESLGKLLLDSSIGIPTLVAHKFLRSNARKVNLETLFEETSGKLPTEPIAKFAGDLWDWISILENLGLYGLIQKIGEELYVKNAKNHDSLIRDIEIIRTYLHILSGVLSKEPQTTIADFVAYLSRMEKYGYDIPLNVFSGKEGVQVLTLHGSKGLEFEYVYIAHLDESSLMRGRRGGFTLPERLESLIQAKDELSARRELYVAITRAKTHCTLSYARNSYSGGELQPAKILADFPESLIEHKNILESEGELIQKNPEIFVKSRQNISKTTRIELAKVVSLEYQKANVTVTLLNNFFECPWKWYFRNLLLLPEAKTESLIVGTIVHSGIEYILKNRDDFDNQIDNFLSVAIEKENIFDENVAKRTFREARNIISNFVKNYLPKIDQYAVSERSISYKDPEYPHLNFYGKIDMTEEVGDGVVCVTDFKTGGGKSKNTIEKNDEEGRLNSFLRQLAMYKYLIESNQKMTEVGLEKLVFVEEKSNSKDAIYVTKIKPEEVLMLKKDFADYDKELSSGSWINRPCRAKNWGKNEKCEYCALAKELYE